MLKNLFLQNKEVIREWLHDLVSLNIPLFNTGVGRFLKAQISIDLLGKVISERGWVTPTNKTVYTLQDANFIDNFNSEEDYNLQIEGYRVSVKGSETSALTTQTLLKKMRGKVSMDFGADYLLLYTPITNKPGSLGLLSKSNAVPFLKLQEHAIVLSPIKDPSVFDCFLSFKKSLTTLSLSNEEYTKEYRKFRNRICDTICSK